MRFRHLFIIAVAVAMVVGGSAVAFGYGRPSSWPTYNTAPSDTTGVSGDPSGVSGDPSVPMSVPKSSIYQGRPVLGDISSSMTGDTTGVSGDASVPVSVPKSSIYQGKDREPAQS